MSNTFRAGDNEFEFETHGTNWGYNSKVCVNIKFHHSPRLPKRAKKRLERLIEVEHVEEYEIDNHAFEAAQDDWWEWAKERVGEYGLGEIYSAGRSGGYLVLSMYSPERVWEICEDYERECTHCGDPYDEHSLGRCLFDTTRFESTEPGSLELLKQIQAFLKEAEMSIDTWARENYDYRFKEEINYRWSQWRESLKADEENECADVIGMSA